MLGEEADAVAVGMVDLAEPDYINVSNCHDYFRNDGVLIEGCPDPESVTGGCSGCVCLPLDARVWMSFSGEQLRSCEKLGNYDFDLGIIGPGKYKRVVILQDQPRV